jgi:hypothetical protein
MPHNARHQHTETGVPFLSVIRCSLTEEELFLSVAPGFESGPPIMRSGTGSPYMYHVGGPPGEITTNAFGLRLGSWLIRESLRKEAIVEALVELERTDVSAEDRTVLQETVEELLSDQPQKGHPQGSTDGSARSMLADISRDATRLITAVFRLDPSKEDYKQKLTGYQARLDRAMPFAEQIAQSATQSSWRSQLLAHAEHFLKNCPDHSIVAQQGNGDMSMNYWNVGFINDGKYNGGKPKLLFLNGEPVQDRVYTCLIKWKRTDLQPRPQLSIENVRFQPYPGPDDHRMVWIHYDSRWVPCGDRIEFAVSNRQVIRDGRLVPIDEISERFSDLRHLIAMPNLNPQNELFAGEPPNPGGSHRPRTYFGQPQYSDVWLGENVFLRDVNMRHLALNRSVELEFPPGADSARLRGALQQTHYLETTNGAPPSKPGEWRFVQIDPLTQRLDIYFRPNIYGWSMIGLTKDRSQILCLACTADHRTRQGYTLTQAAEILLENGAHDALLIDEGQDVFQSVWWQGYGDPEHPLDPDERVLRSRKQLRSTFIIAKQRG